MYDSYYTWILLVPVLISLIASIGKVPFTILKSDNINWLNFSVFLVNVVRVLLTKLHPNSAQPAPLALRKAARATLILVPLFGLQNVLLPFRPNLDSFYEKYYQVLSAILVSLQVNHAPIYWNLFSYPNWGFFLFVHVFLKNHKKNVPPIYWTFTIILIEDSSFFYRVFVFHVCSVLLIMMSSLRYVIYLVDIFQ